MAPNHSKLNNNNKPQGFRITPPIPLDRPAAAKPIKGQYETLKLRNNPSSADSLGYEINIPYFSTGTAEQWIMFLKNLNQAITGQGLTTGPMKYALTKRLLKGDALACFNASAIKHDTETNEHFKLVIEDLTKHIFPRLSLQMQKRWMRRYVRKPHDVAFCQHAARVVEINDYLPQFPPARET